MRHPPEIAELARERTPEVPIKQLMGTERWQVTDALPPGGSVGIELGVAAGSFSARMVQSGRFREFYGVDSYTDGHSVIEYQTALRATGLWSDYRLLRMNFSQAVTLFPDENFDFIYVDGYAHTGCEGGRTLSDWYPKLKPGGVMAGDDYHPQVWPLVVWAVHEAAAQLNATLSITDLVRKENYNRRQSWSFVRPMDGPSSLSFSKDLQEVAEAEKARIGLLRKEARRERRKAGG